MYRLSQRPCTVFSITLKHGACETLTPVCTVTTRPSAMILTSNCQGVGALETLFAECFFFFASKKKKPLHSFIYAWLLYLSTDIVALGKKYVESFFVSFYDVSKLAESFFFFHWSHFVGFVRGGPTQLYTVVGDRYHRTVVYSFYLRLVQRGKEQGSQDKISIGATNMVAHW